MSDESVTECHGTSHYIRNISLWCSMVRTTARAAVVLRVRVKSTAIIIKHALRSYHP